MVGRRSFEGRVFPCGRLRSSGGRPATARVLHDYPSLTAEDIDEAIRFYEAHRAEIDADLLDEQGPED